MAGLYAPNTFVVDSESLGANNLCRAVLGYRNLFVTGSPTTTSEDANYPFELAFDYKTNTEYSPFISSGTVTINIYNSEIVSSNYLGVFSKNGGDCGLSILVEVLDPISGDYESVGTLEDFENARPKMLYWKDRGGIAQRLTLTFTSKCYISSLSLGQAIVFGRTVSVGYQPGRNASLDEVSNFTTDGNNFIQGRRIRNSDEEKAPINYQTYGFVDLWWREFMNHVLDSKPVFFMANNQLQHNCIYGLQNPATLTKPSYKNSHHTDIELEIRGWA